MSLQSREPLDSSRLAAGARRDVMSSFVISSPRRPAGVVGGLPEGVNVIGYARGETGEAEITRQVVACLRQAGIRYSVKAIAQPLAPNEDVSCDLGEQGVDFDVTIACIGINMFEHLRASALAYLLERTVTIAIWPWEVDVLPQEWLGRERGLAEVWGISDYGSIAFRRQLAVPVHTFVPTVPPLPAPERCASYEDRPYSFFFSFSFNSVVERKNPYAVLQAFKEAFAPGEGPLLFLKSIGGDRDELQAAQLALLRAMADGRDDVIIYDGFVDGEQQRALLAGCDAYVSLHRAEGFGYTMAEAMMFGKPVIATAWSGNLDFMTPETGIFVPASIVRVPPNCPPYSQGTGWAEPHVPSAAAAMRFLYEHPQAGEAMGRRARAHMLANHTPAARASFVAERVAAVRAACR